MFAQRLRSLGIGLVFCTYLCLQEDTEAQQPPPPPAPEQIAPQPDGVQVQARGPVHEAFATAASQPQATPLVPKRPPAPIDEMPPAERPEGDVAWIPGYWAWDEERNDFLWVSGCWRTKPPGKEWVAGYWRDQDNQAQWVPGFWTAAAAAAPQGQAAAPTTNVTYYPPPPTAPQTAPPGNPPNADSFYVPGNYVWNDNRYLWQAGYWARVQPGYVWVPAHYRWTPCGVVFIPGYWDLAVPRRGILYAPVVVARPVVGVSFVYTPTLAVSSTILLDTLFIRPTYGHYYFGDYYDVRYQRFGYVNCVVYSRTYYDPIIAYRRWEYRGDPNWLSVQINLVSARERGLAPIPARGVILALGPRVMEAHGMRVVPVSAAARAEIRDHARVAQQAALAHRREVEAAHRGPLTAPHTTALHVHAPVAPPHEGAPGHPAAAPHVAPAHPQPRRPEPEKKKEERK